MDCCTPASLSIANSRSLLKLTSIESVMQSSHLILCHPLLLLPSIFTSIRVFSNESVLPIRWPKYWSFSFSMSPSNEYSGLISFRMDWLDLPGVQGTLKHLLQHCSSKASIFRCSAFFIVQLSLVRCIKSLVSLAVSCFQVSLSFPRALVVSLPPAVLSGWHYQMSSCKSAHNSWTLMTTWIPRPARGYPASWLWPGQQRVSDDIEC